MAPNLEPNLVVMARAGSKRLPNKNIKTFVSVMTGDSILHLSLLDIAALQAVLFKKRLEKRISRGISMSSPKVSVYTDCEVLEGSLIDQLQNKDLLQLLDRDPVDDTESSADSVRYLMQNIIEPDAAPMGCVVLFQPTNPYRSHLLMTEAEEALCSWAASPAKTVTEEGVAVMTTAASNPRGSLFMTAYNDDEAIDFPEKVDITLPNGGIHLDIDYATEFDLGGALFSQAMVDLSITRRWADYQPHATHLFFPTLEEISEWTLS